jgi:hypothetical protein
VLFGAGIDDLGNGVVEGLDEGKGLWHLGHAALVAHEGAVDTLPRARVGEGHVVGGKAHDGAVVVVHLLRLKHLGAAENLDRPRDHGGAVKQGTGDVAQGMEEEVIDDGNQHPSQKLFIVLLASWIDRGHLKLHRDRVRTTVKARARSCTHPKRATPVMFGITPMVIF